MRFWSSFGWIALASAMGVPLGAACSNGAVGVQACRQIETARCEAAPACPMYFDLSQPVPDGDPVAACVRYYNDECLHGLVTSVAPSSAEVNQCAAAITAAGKAAAVARDAGPECALVANPATNLASVCSWLTPIDAGTPDAGEDSGNDAGTD
jgi:hypothetical protein